MIRYVLAAMVVFGAGLLAIFGYLGVAGLIEMGAACPDGPTCADARGAAILGVPLALMGAADIAAAVWLYRRWRRTPG